MNRESLAWGVTRLQSTFGTRAGRTKTIHGTGFWINVDNYLREFAFVTNKHNIDPLMKLDSSYSLVELKIELRKREINPKRPTEYALLPTTHFATVTNLESSLYMADSADCAVIYPPCFVDQQPEHTPFAAFRLHDLADKRFFNNDVQMTDPCHFVGFPYDPSNNTAWWDQKYNVPISRAASIASHPATYISFSHPEIKVDDVILVSGLSFFGSSGSPVISEQKGIGTDSPGFSDSSFIKVTAKPTGPGDHETYATPNVNYHFEDPNYVAPRLIGVMTGHCNFGTESKFDHTGLSYFTRSTTIIELMEKIGFWRNELGMWFPKKRQS